LVAVGKQIADRIADFDGVILRCRGFCVGGANPLAGRFVIDIIFVHIVAHGA
jgi:hypothetical protein